MSSLTLLPLMPDELERGTREALDFLIEDGFPEREAALKLEADVNNWLDEVETQKFPPPSVELVLSEAGWYQKLTKPKQQTPGKLYGLMIFELSEREGETRRTAAVTLSYLPLIVNLATKFRLSAAGIAEVIKESDDRVLLHWKGIRTMMGHLRLPTKLGDAGVEAMLEQDELASSEMFKDADVSTIIEMLSREASRFELGRDFAEAVKSSLSPAAGDVFVPYLQILFYVNTITEFFDHPPEYLYTFQPRGGLGNKIFGVFPSQMAATGNPILNNFKAVDRLSTDWAAARDDNPEQAFALVSIILGLSSLSYSSRRYMARQFRCGLLRYIDVRCPLPLELPKANTVSQVHAFLNRVANSETNTAGIVEQRVTDYLAVSFYSDSCWRSRGLKDPVNATNTSSRKLGDADFQNATEHRCLAVEAHAGRLTPVYVNEHLRTLRRNISARLDEWESIEDLSLWQLELVFVVHEDACNGYIPAIDLEVQSELKIVHFSEWVEKWSVECVEDETAAIRLFNEHVVEVLAAGNTPYRVKEVALSLMGT